MAFNFLSNLVNNQHEIDEFGSNVDGENGLSDESDVEFDFDDANSPTEGDNSRSRSRSSESSDTEDEIEDDQGERSPHFQWSTQFSDVEIDLFSRRPGSILVDTDLDYNSEPIDFVELFLPPSLIEVIVNQSNLYAEQKNAPTSFRKISTQDIRSYIFVNMMFGIHKIPSYRQYWSKDPLLHVSCIADVMSRNRYEEICRYLHLTDSTKAIPRGQPGFDALYKLRPLIDCILTASEQYYYPGTALSFDEAMVPFTGRLYFKQYIKGKPNPWGVKVWCCADPSSGYLCNFRFYTGKEDYPPEKGLGHHVVWSLGQRFLDRNHHFYFDNFFSSIQLSYDLLQRSTYSCGTIRTNRKHWPVEFRKIVLANGEVRFRQSGNLLATVWKDKRQIALVSTNSSATTDTVQRRAKGGPIEKTIPNAVSNYNTNMGGVDLNDQLRSYYTIGRKSVKWWRCCFFYLLEVAVLNSYIIYKNTPRPAGEKVLDHFQFHLEVARSFMTVSLRKRSVSSIPSVQGMVACDFDKHKRVRLPGRKKQCFNCRSEDRRTESGKRPETVFGCSLCNTHLCDEMCFGRFHKNLLK